MLMVGYDLVTGAHVTKNIFFSYKKGEFQKELRGRRGRNSSLKESFQVEGAQGAQTVVMTC